MIKASLVGWCGTALLPNPSQPHSPSLALGPVHRLSPPHILATLGIALQQYQPVEWKRPRRHPLPAQLHVRMFTPPQL
jgi:hypothetical protein